MVLLSATVCVARLDAAMSDDEADDDDGVNEDDGAARNAYGDSLALLSARFTSLTGRWFHIGSVNAFSTCATSFTLNCSSIAMTGTREPRSGAWTGNDMYCKMTFLR